MSFVLIYYHVDCGFDRADTSTNCLAIKYLSVAVVSSSGNIFSSR